MPRRRPFQPNLLPEEVVASPPELTGALALLRAAPVLAFDTEFVGEDSYRPDLCLVQVATPDRLFLIDPLSCGPLDGFWELLLDPNRVAVVHAGREEIRMCRYGVNRPPARTFDVQIAAALVGMAYPIGYAGLVQEVLGVRTGKGETLTDWRRRPLTAAQVRYGFDDVRYLLPLYDRLRERLAQLDRLGWADEEFAAAVRRALADDPTVEKWRRIKGTGGLGRRELAVVRAVYLWRDEFAARLNRPPRVLLRDDLVLEVARRAPTKLDDLQALRGLPRGEADAILAAVGAALALSPAEFPLAVERDNDPPHVAQLAGFLGVVLADFAARSDLAPNLVATTADLKALVRARQPGGRLPDDSPFRSGWRGAAVRPHLDAVLDGRRAVRVADPAAATPFAVEPVGMKREDEPTPETQRAQRKDTLRIKIEE